MIPRLLLAASFAHETYKVAPEAGFATSPMTMMGLLALMALVPFAIMMLTSFSKIVVVLSLARSAMGSQQAPPTIVLTGLAAVLTAHIMAPVAERMWEAGQAAYREGGSSTQMLASS